MYRRTFLAGTGALLTAGCLPPEERIYAPLDEVAAVAFRDPGPSYLVLYTMKNTDTRNGAHTSLMINASQRVIFDPFGSLRHPRIPERGDVLFGITPAVLSFYESYHARETYFVTRQKIVVPPETAELALQLAEANGPVGMAGCTRATSHILTKLPGFSPPVRTTLFPDSLQSSFAKLPGVEYSEFWEYDDGVDRSAEVAEFEAAEAATAAP